MVDAETGEVVESDQKGRGYELSKGKYVEIEKEELEAVQIESNHTIDIDSFVPRGGDRQALSTISPITSCPTARPARRRSPSSATP